MHVSVAVRKCFCFLKLLITYRYWICSSDTLMIYFRIKSRAHDPPIDNPVYGTSAITSVKTQNFADLAASHLKTESSGGEEEAGRDYHVLEGPLPEGSINSENYVIPGEEDSSVDSASVQSYEVPVNKHDNVGEEEEDEYREFFIPVKISKVQDCKFVLSTQD